MIRAVNMQQKSEIIYFCRSLCEVQNISYCPVYAIVRTKRILRVLFYRSKTAKTFPTGQINFKGQFLQKINLNQSRTCFFTKYTEKTTSIGIHNVPWIIPEKSGKLMIYGLTVRRTDGEETYNPARFHRWGLLRIPSRVNKRNTLPTSMWEKAIY